MNKKGMLLASETLKIVIAAICIGFLIYLLAAIYFASSGAEENKEARSQLDKISTIIDNFDSGNLSGEVLALTPKGWGLFSFNQSEEMPNACAGTNCICFCDVATFYGQISDCDEANICLVNERLLDFPDIEFEEGGATSIRVERVGQRITVTKI